MIHSESEVRQDLGPCCACGCTGETVRNIMMLHKKSPTPGKGWGCLQCGLEPDGAVAVVCDACLEAKAPYKFACVGWPGKDGRVPIEQLHGSHDHDMSRHPESGGESLPMYVIYERPGDYPDSFVVRRHDVLGNRAIATSDMRVCSTLEEARQPLEAAGLYNLGREEADEPQIVEVWV